MKNAWQKLKTLFKLKATTLRFHNDKNDVMLNFVHVSSINHRQLRWLTIFQHFFFEGFSRLGFQPRYTLASNKCPIILNKLWSFTSYYQLPWQQYEYFPAKTHNSMQTKITIKTIMTSTLQERACESKVPDIWGEDELPRISQHLHYTTSAKPYNKLDCFKKYSKWTVTLLLM